MSYPSKKNSYESYITELQKEIKSAYLITGDDGFSKTKFVEYIEKQLVKPDFRSIDRLLTYGDEMNEDMLSWLWLMPFGSKKRLLIVRGAEVMLEKEYAGITSKIQSYLDKPSFSGVLVIVAEPLPKNKLKYKPKKELSFSNITTCEFKKLGGNDIGDTIKRKLRNEKVIMEKEGIVLLQEIFGNDLNMLRTEIDKIISFVAPSKEIKLSDVEAMQSYSLEGSIYNLTRLIGKRERTKAIETLELLLNLREKSGGEKANGVLWEIYKYFENLLKLKIHPEECKEGKFYYIRGEANLWEEESLVNALAKIFDAEFAIKTGKGEPDLVVTKLIYNLCS
ncbi:MAG: DNA polymerase III subunit delta [bacterium]|nr:DNA polymerase III subunit delta [bacterium]